MDDSDKHTSLLHLETNYDIKKTLIALATALPTIFYFFCLQWKGLYNKTFYGHNGKVATVKRALDGSTYLG